MNPEAKDLDEKLKVRFAQLPKVVQDAITSADVQKRMRALADTQKLHIDQYNSLENEVMLALLGFQPVEDLEKNIKSEVKVSDEVAHALTEEISKLVFEPIRQELERQLQNPDAKPVQQTGVEAMAAQTLAAEAVAATPVAPAAPPVAPGTPPAPANEEKAVRAPVSESYKPGETSTERKVVHDDPYREAP